MAGLIRLCPLGCMCPNVPYFIILLCLTPVKERVAGNRWVKCNYRIFAEYYSWYQLLHTSKKNNCECVAMKFRRYTA